eukprot:COSAG01_NODE_1236_length_11101_cov_6.515179_13_plen_85_part_00
MAPRIRLPKQVSVHNLRSHSISTFNRYDRRISTFNRYDRRISTTGRSIDLHVIKANAAANQGTEFSLDRPIDQGLSRLRSGRAV